RWIATYIRLSGSEVVSRTSDFCVARRKSDAAFKFFLCGIGIYFWRTGQEEFFVWSSVRLPDFANHYIYRGAVRSPLLPRRDANCYSRGGLADAADHGRERRGVSERGGQHFHGADGSSADHSAVPAKNDQIGIDDRHNQRHCSRVRRNHG